MPRPSKWEFNLYPNKPLFLRICSMNLLKTLWEKEKLLVTSNFSFSHSVCYPLYHFHQNCRLQTLSVWKSIKFVFWEIAYTLFSLVQFNSICSGRYINVACMIEFVFDGVQNFVGKGENAGYQHFLLFSQYFQKAPF